MSRTRRHDPTGDARVAQAAILSIGNAPVRIRVIAATEAPAVAGGMKLGLLVRFSVEQIEGLELAGYLAPGKELSEALEQFFSDSISEWLQT